MLSPQNRFRLESGLFLICACMFVSVGHLYNWMTPLDRVIYDTVIANTQAPMYEDLVIVAIDDNSLHDAGPWPWPRSQQARLINAVQSHNPRLIAVDVVYAGETPEDDVLVEAASKVDQFAAPLIIDTTLQDGQHIEVLPFPALAEQTDILGHVQVELDDDAIVRGTYLYQGVGRPVWPHLVVAIGQALGINPPPACPQTSHSPLLISKCRYVQIPFAGPPSTYPQISAALLLSPGLVDAQILNKALKDKVVLIGATALGVGDWIASPLGDEVTPLSGVEFNANLLSALIHGTIIRTAPGWATIAVACLLVALICLALPRLRPRQGILTIVITALVPILLTAILLSTFSLHIPLASVTVASAIIYPLWSWRRHEVAWTFIESELNRIDAEGQRLPGISPQTDDIQALQQILGASLSSQNEDTLVVQREQPLSGPEQDLLKHTLELRHATPADALPAERLAAQIGRLQNRAKVVREGREIGLSALDHMSSGALIISATGHIIFANEEAHRLLTLKDNPDLLQSVADVQPPLGENWLEIWRAVVFEHEAVVFESHAADTTPVFITAGPLTDPDLEFAPYWVLTISDLSEVRHAQAQREEALAFLSHDLRSPLTSVLALLEQHRGEDPDGVLEHIRSYTQKALSASDQFLQLSRLQLHSDIEFYSVELEQICQNAIEQLFFLAREKDITITLNEPEQEVWLSANGELLERAFINLLSNAIKYSPDNTRISLSFELGTDQVCVVVADQGYGIPADELPHIFEPYFRSRTQELARNRGAGLGLRFVKTVVDRHHGRISAESTVGSGTVFRMVLPLLDQDSITATT